MKRAAPALPRFVVLAEERHVFCLSYCVLIATVFYETIRFRFVRYWPTEIDLDLDDLIIAHGDNLGVAKAMPVRAATFIGDEYPVAIGNEIDKIETADPFAVRLATRKIGRAVNAVIKRTGEVEIRGDQFLDCRTILSHIGFVSCARDCDDIVWHSFFLLAVSASPKKVMLRCLRVGLDNSKHVAGRILGVREPADFRDRHFRHADFSAALLDFVDRSV